MILFTITTLALTAGAWVLLRAAPVGDGPADKADDASTPGPTTVSFDADVTDDGGRPSPGDPGGGMPPADDAAWDEIMARVRARSSVAPPPEPEPEPGPEEEAFDMAALAARLAAEGFDEPSPRPFASRRSTSP